MDPVVEGLLRPPSAPSGNSTVIVRSESSLSVHLAVDASAVVPAQRAEVGEHGVGAVERFDVMHLAIVERNSQPGTMQVACIARSIARWAKVARRLPVGGVPADGDATLVEEHWDDHGVGEMVSPPRQRESNPSEVSLIVTPSGSRRSASAMGDHGRLGMLWVCPPRGGDASASKANCSRGGCPRRHWPARFHRRGRMWSSRRRRRRSSR
ncbi:MAG: hypothetical protein R2715_23580 [Ilumatobacteraceae bacterium]